MFKSSVTSVVKKYIPTFIKSNADVIPVLVGDPGISKTQQLHQLCEENNWGLYPVHLGLTPIEKLSGIPRILEDKNGKLITKWSEPEIIAEANKLAEKHEYVILFFDDIHLADKTRQSYFFELASEHKIQGYKLADNVKIVCAGNPSTKAGAKTFLSAIINRFTFINVELPVKEWIMWATENGVHDLVTAYIMSEDSNPAVLCGKESTEPYPTPRSWYKVSEIIKSFELLHGNSINMIISKDRNALHDLKNMISGTIGSQTASDFFTFLEYTYDVNYDELFKEPEKLFEYPQSKRIAVFFMMITKLAEKKYKKYFFRFIDFVYTKMDQEGKSIQFSIIVISKLKSINRSMINLIIDHKRKAKRGFIDPKYRTIDELVNEFIDKIIRKVNELNMF